MANNATGHLIYILDIFIIGILISNETVIASYKVATIIPNALIFIPSSLMVYLYPYFAEKNCNKIWVRENYFKIIKYFGVFNIFLSGILIILAPFIIKLLFGTQYLDAVLSFRILTLGYLISATFRKVSGNLLVTQRKLKFNFLLGIFEGIVNLIGNVVLVSLYGSIGAAIASLIVVILSSILSVRYFVKVVS
jgi:O-antigen/teichoic acid export membrane protein